MYPTSDYNLLSQARIEHRYKIHIAACGFFSFLMNEEDCFCVPELEHFRGKPRTVTLVSQCLG